MSNLLQFPSPALSPRSQPNDTPAREAALDTHASCIVEAPAGSGKTGLLMQRFLKLLADEQTQRPEEILAITFTNKATAELRQRVLEQLTAARNQTPLKPAASDFEATTRQLAEAALARDAILHWGMIDRPHSLNIRTIDSVCAEIANSAPLLSGGGGNRTPAADPTPLYRLAAQRTLLQLGTPDVPLHKALRSVLLHRDASLSDVETLLADMLKDRDQWAELVPLGPEVLDDETLDREVRARLEAALENIVCVGLTRAANLMPAGMLHKLAKLAAQLGMNPGYKGDSSPIAFCADRRTPPEEKADHLDHWQALISLLLTKGGEWRKKVTGNLVNFEISKTESAALQDLIDIHKSDPLCDALCAVRNLPDARYPDDQWLVAKALFRVLRRALAELHVLFSERNECDFIEFAFAARHALHSDDTDGPAIDLALSAGGHLRHLLVDEMQDTSAAQYDLIHQLTRTWDGATQTLFLVGDPKQSIYLFRQARVERFLRTMHEGRFGDIPLQPLRLTSNFRSQATLVHSFNASFERIFPAPDAITANPSDVPFVAAIPSRPASPTADLAWHPSVLGEESIDTGRPLLDHETLQARDIRRIIEDWLARPLPEDRSKPWRIAVLARARKHLDAIVKEFKRDHGYGPLVYRAVDIDSLSSRPEVFDALALTRALLHPADRTAWLAVLHAPWCGLSLADLLVLTGEGSGTNSCVTVATLVAAREQYLSEEGRRLLARAWPVLSSATATLGHDPLDTQVERTWRSLGGDVSLTPSERSNVLRYFSVLRKVILDLGYLDLKTLSARLETLYAEPSSAQCPVELLTIHKAKGLEWDVVLVPSLERPTGRVSADLLNWLEIDSSSPGTAGVLLAPIQSKGEDAGKLNKWLTQTKESRENAERKRLFYVLATRAREELHLFAACKRKNDGTLGQPAHGSLLKAIWPAAETVFAPLQQQPAKQLPLPGDLTERLRLSLETDPGQPLESLALAASAASESPRIPIIHRLPISFNPRERFAAAEDARLLYTPVAALRQSPAFHRPEGSFAVRAFGNVVHRFLQLLSGKLASEPNAAAMLTELPTWLPRLTASFRAEGLSPAGLDTLARRALTALTNALTDPIGLWLLSPHTAAASEQALSSTGAREMRIDRTFRAGPTPLSTGDTHLWIVDFKTTGQGARSDEEFARMERAKYAPQLESYARAASGQTILLGLYYPLIPSLVHWTSAPTEF